MRTLQLALIRMGRTWPLRLLRPSFRSSQKLLRQKKSAWARMRLVKRWKKAGLPIGESTPLPLEDVPVIVINLPSRPDRMKDFSSEMLKINVTNVTVVPGVPGRELYPDIPGDFSGAIGCNLAHSNAVEAIDWSGHSLQMICEDDLEFLVSRSEIDTLLGEFVANEALDVLCLAGRVRGAKIPISENLYLATGIVGQACYVLKPHMAAPLANLWRSGVEDLSRERLRGKNDHIWNTLQAGTSFFAFPRAQIARQRESFSDIQGRNLPPQESSI